MVGPIRGNRQSATILVLTHTTQDCDNKIDDDDDDKEYFGANAYYS